MSNQRAWQMVASGLELKFAGLVLLAGLPLLAVLLWLCEADPRWLLLGIGVAALPDFLGRCLCLAAPRPAQLWIVLSVAFQMLSFGALGAAAWLTAFESTDGIVEVTLGVSVAATLQLVAAFLFTKFLRTAGEVLQDKGVTYEADQLNWWLAWSLIASWGLSFATFLSAAIVLIVGIVTCGLGFYVATPLALLLLLPILMLVIALVIAMYWSYGAAMIRLRTAIRGRDPDAEFARLTRGKGNVRP